MKDTLCLRKLALSLSLRACEASRHEQQTVQQVFEFDFARRSSYCVKVTWRDFEKRYRNSRVSNLGFFNAFSRMRRRVLKDNSQIPLFAAETQFTRKRYNSGGWLFNGHNEPTNHERALVQFLLRELRRLQILFYTNWHTFAMRKKGLKHVQDHSDIESAEDGGGLSSEARERRYLVSKSSCSCFSTWMGF